MSLDPVKNFAKVTLNQGYAAGILSVDLIAGDGAKLPDPATDGAFNLVWWDNTNYSDPSDDPNKEIVRCTARLIDNLTITRAQEGTIAANHNISDTIYRMIVSLTKKMKDDIETMIGGTKVDEEVPAGIINGVNTTFTLAHTPIAGTLHLFKSGLRLYGSGNDYTLVGDTTTMTFAPRVGSILLADYRYL